jgi:hypothetical protein
MLGQPIEGSQLRAEKPRLGQTPCLTCCDVQHHHGAAARNDRSLADPRAFALHKLFKVKRRTFCASRKTGASDLCIMEVQQIKTSATSAQGNAARGRRRLYQLEPELSRFV